MSKVSMYEIFKKAEKREQEWKEECKNKDNEILSKEDIQRLKKEWNLTNNKDIIQKYKKEIIQVLKIDADSKIMRIKNQLEYDIEKVNDNRYFFENR